MQMFVIAAFTGFQWLMAITLFCVCVLLMLIILIQKGRGGGLASAFGGAGGGGGAFGTKTGDVFTGITVVLAFVFLLLTVFGNFIFMPAVAGQSRPAVQSAPGGAAGGSASLPAGAAAPQTGEQVPEPGDIAGPEGPRDIEPTPAATDNAPADVEANDETPASEGSDSNNTP